VFVYGVLATGELPGGWRPCKLACGKRHGQSSHRRRGRQLAHIHPRDKVIRARRRQRVGVAASSL
jgi:hypothetical protein